MKKAKNRIKNEAFSIRNLYWAWVLSLVLFFLSLFYIRYEIVTATGISLPILVFIVLGGIVVYLVLMLKILTGLKTSRARWYGVATISTFFIFFWLLFNLENVEAKLGFSPPSSRTSTSQPLISAPKRINSSPTPNRNVQQPTNTNNVVSNKINCTGPDGVTFKTTQKECDEFNTAWGNTSEPIQNTQEVNHEDLSPCNLSVGTFNLTHEQCLQYTQLDLQLTTQQMEYTVDQIYTYDPATYDGGSTTSSSNNAELLSACKANAQSIYQSESRRISSEARALGTGGSAVERALADLKNNLERAVDSCEQQYPLN